MTSVDPTYVRNPAIAMTEMLEDLIRKPRRIAAGPFNRLVTDIPCFSIPNLRRCAYWNGNWFFAPNPASPFTT
jgi:hypothetical protein